MLNIHKLNIAQGDFHLSVSTKIAPGLTMLIGQNGSGKSTFMTGITGFYDENTKTHRDVRYENKRFTHHLYSYLPQEMPRSNLSVKDFVELTTGKDSKEVLVVFRLTDIRNKRIETLSGGEFKRAQLAQIILEDKPIILLDEIDQNLDIAFQKHVFEYLSTLKNKIILVSVHQLSLSLKYADEIMVIKQGALLAKSAPENIDSSILSHAFDTDIRIERLNGTRHIIL
ncbi:ABC transporter ATP-binding protein [Phocicoccus pinnipedialis]|uniref:Iron(3+)-hydroxamate import ATP-binding protein FhuC n=1 Tax=Phocicoccus pinnipedialis TaxID=110845 RepID=A0A6V7R5D4_9BACL|nr:ABC transporter ATP-binding protein [Jeotgalicoccus pinnipedialis]MBP1939960.1 ABC-type cobalamin/Fe3+-siderophores transport system ATPase subunit [Jeotgalicoccus pinnipedialis]CAD2072092.1 Iron(3+)-hydroxamate import ATP-binding protein FhuC [Jeotgalicoccus pinnipedialis]